MPVAEPRALPPEAEPESQLEQTKLREEPLEYPVPAPEEIAVRQPTSPQAPGVEIPAPPHPQEVPQIREIQSAQQGKLDEENLAHSARVSVSALEEALESAFMRAQNEHKNE
jgi:hypothetical protein